MSYLYFVRGKAEGPIKIGYSQDPVRRLIALQAGSPIPLTLLGTRRGGRKEEEALHRKFAHARLHGEWFRAVPEVLAEIPKHIPVGAYSIFSPTLLAPLEDNALVPPEESAHPQADMYNHVYQFMDSFSVEGGARVRDYKAPLLALNAIVDEVLLVKRGRVLLDSLGDLED